MANSHYLNQLTLEPDEKGNLVNVLSFPKGVETYGNISAIDPATGKLARQERTSKPFSGGVTSTAGGLVFMGESDGHFTARDSRTGKLLWRFQTGAGGNKLFNIPSGNAVIAFGLPDASGE